MFKSLCYLKHYFNNILLKVICGISNVFSLIDHFGCY